MTGRASGQRVMRLAVMVAIVVLVVTACRGDAPPASARNIPRAEFLLAAGDSTYWVRSDGQQLRVRSAPLLLTEVDGALVELFVSDDGAEYADASFLMMRLWARPLRGTDSVLLFSDRDSAVTRALTAWRRRHPGEMELLPDDEAAAGDPATMVHDELDLLDVHGPYLTVERRFDADFAGGPPHVHRIERFVLDVRTGTRQTLASLFGAAQAVLLEQRGRTDLQQLLDSIRSAGDHGDARATAAKATLASFRFDPASFAITDVARAPAIEFMVPGHGATGQPLTLRLPVTPVTPPSWWGTVAGTLPAWSSDSSRVTWVRAPYVVRAQRMGDDQLAVSLAVTDTASSASVAPVTTVEGPVYQLIALDAAPLDSGARAALNRTFDAATMLDAGAEQASFRGIRPRRGLIRIGADARPSGHRRTISVTTDR